MKRDILDYTEEDSLWDKLRDAQDEMPIKCHWCRGRGVQYLDGGRLQYKCPDCEGTGELQEEAQ